MNEGRGRETILADLFEALIGAIYLDGGIAEVKRLFWMHFEKEIQTILEHPPATGSRASRLFSKKIPNSSRLQGR